jgi:hypothetical protein
MDNLEAKKRARNLPRPEDFKLLNIMKQSGFERMNVAFRILWTGFFFFLKHDALSDLFNLQTFQIKLCFFQTEWLTWRMKVYKVTVPDPPTDILAIHQSGVKNINEPS